MLQPPLLLLLLPNLLAIRRAKAAMRRQARPLRLP
jgi:hypothetical protein